VDFVPVHPPEPVHDVALVELHVNVVVPPLLTVVCAALREAVGKAAVFAPDEHATTNKTAGPSSTNRMAEPRTRRRAQFFKFTKTSLKSDPQQVSRIFLYRT
jgi:hypothetical protein